MQKKFPSKRRGLALAVMVAAAGATMPLSAQQNEPEVEEVIVTGSYIRGSALDAPSPVSVVDRDSIQAQGASTIWDVIRNLEVNQGSDTNVEGAMAGSGSQNTGTASVNLRNLGGNSTLTLINGKRSTPAAVVTASGQESVNLNSIPLVMTERVEVLTDGGSALYGADAVAGVVNIIMRTDFDGLELYADTNGIQEAGGTYEETFSGIWGTDWNNGNTRLVLSGEYFERDPQKLEHAQYFDEDRIISNSRVGSFSPTSPLGATFNMGYLDMPLTGQNKAERAGIGEAAGGTRGFVYSDPLCESGSGEFGQFYVDNRYTDFARRSGQCSENNMGNQFMTYGQERYSLAGSFEHDFNNGMEFYSFFNSSDSEITREWDGRSFSRTLHIFWGPEALGSLAPYIGNTPTGIAQNNPNLQSNGGFGQGWYGGGVATGWPTTRTSGLPTDQKESNVQAGFRGDFEGFGRNLEWDLSVAWSESSIEQEVSTLQRDRTELAINGLGGPNCTPNGSSELNFMAVPAFAPLGGLFNLVFPNYVLNTYDTSALALTSTNHGRDGCQFFNPFLTSLTDPNLANSPELIDWMDQRILRADKRNELFVVDYVMNGDLGEMSGGTAAFAAGLQYRKRNASGRAPEINYPGLSPIKSYAEGLPFPASLFAPVTERYSEITNNLECANCIFNFDDQRDIRSLFVELSLPWAENVETQVALRYEDYEDIGSALSPKIAASWRPVEELLLRASWSESFRAPNIGVVNQAFEANGTTIQDPIRNQEVRAGILPATNENAIANFFYTRGRANPDLDPEYADTFNVGFQWTPGGDLDGLSVGADIWRFEVEDRVLPLVPRAAINPEIEKFNSVVGDENNYVLNDSIPLDARGPDGNAIPCSPSALASQYGANSDERINCVVNPDLYIVDGVQRLYGSDTASGVTLVLPAVNAGTYEVQGVDFKAGYTWNNDYGTFRVGLDYTHIDQFKVDIPGLDLGLQATGKFDAAGVDGEQNIVRPVPDNRGNINFSWAKDNHRVSIFNRHIGSFQVLSHDDFMANPNSAEANKAYAKSMTDSYNTWDIQYAYTRDWGDSSSIFTVGVIDATNEDIPLFRRQAYHSSVYDPRGRRWYARVLWQF